MYQSNHCKLSIYNYRQDTLQEIIIFWSSGLANLTTYSDNDEYQLVRHYEKYLVLI